MRVFEPIVHKVFYSTLFIFLSVVFSIRAAQPVLASGGNFAAGTGLATNPYQIEDCSDLQAITNNTALRYILIKNIDCSASATWNGGTGFTPIGSVINKFSGNFNGNGFTISGLSMNVEGGYIGLFNWVNGGTISNVGLINTNITSTQGGYVGALIGTLESGTVSRVYATGSLYVDNGGYTGGLVGRFLAGTISNSYTRLVISIPNFGYAGGIVGYMGGGTVLDTFATGNMTGVAIRGIVGFKAAGTVMDSIYDTATGASDNNGSGVPTSTTAMKLVASYTNMTLGLVTVAWDFVGNPNNDSSNNNYW
ncbi:MAG: hypothetical protein NT034_01360, partial [Candidatus Magasanikbacteria bacterium]|nr:hypothetical protein [Candidatus Magasanikbacteria bacterium]